MTATLPDLPATITKAEPGQSPPWALTPRLADPSLSLAADVVDDLERVRIGNENRLRQMTRDTDDTDGELRGHGLPVDHPDVKRLAGIVAAMAELEHTAILGLKKHMRAHPLWVWAGPVKGLGEKQLARLLAATGDPYWNTLHGRPRTVSELWAYCGLHTIELPADRLALDIQRDTVGGGTTSDPDHKLHGTQHGVVRVAARRKKGQRSSWSNNAKMRAYLCAQSCIKQSESPYRAVYDARRARTADTHPDWTAGHSHNDALRVASKAILRDMWRAAHDWHAAHPEGD